MGRYRLVAGLALDRALDCVGGFERLVVAVRRLASVLAPGLGVLLDEAEGVEVRGELGAAVVQLAQVMRHLGDRLRLAQLVRPHLAA